MREIATILTCICLLLSPGCELGPKEEAGPEAPSPPSGPDPAARPEAEPTGPTDREVMAYVNDEPVYMGRLYELLLRGPGLQFAQELVRHEVVLQAGREKGVVVTEADMEAEQARFMELMAPGLDEAQRQQVLQQIIARKQMSLTQWEMMLRARSILRKLAAEGLEVPEEAVRAQFNREYGRKVVVRHIQTQTLAEAREVRELAQEGDFAALAAEHSINASGKEGGLLPPIGPKSDSVPAAIRDTAMALDVGEVSNPVQVGSTFHVLKAERMIEPKDVKFEDVEAEMRRQVREKILQARGQVLLRQMVADAEVEFVDPVLAEQRKAAEAQPEVPLP